MRAFQNPRGRRAALLRAQPDCSGKARRRRATMRFVTAGTCRSWVHVPAREPPARADRGMDGRVPLGVLDALTSSWWQGGRRRCSADCESTVCGAALGGPRPGQKFSQRGAAEGGAGARAGKVWRGRGAAACPGREHDRPRALRVNETRGAGRSWREASPCSQRGHGDASRRPASTRELPRRDTHDGTAKAPIGGRPLGLGRGGVLVLAAAVRGGAGLPVVTGRGRVPVSLVSRMRAWHGESLRW